MHKIISITIIAALSACVLCSGLSANGSTSWIDAEVFDEALTGTNFAGTTYALTIVAAGMAIYNAGALSSDNPCTYCGLFGTLSGAFVTVYGGTLLASDDNRLVTVGSFVPASGIASLYYGVKSLARVRAKHLESKEQGLSIDPVILNRDCRGTEVGIQISFRF